MMRFRWIEDRAAKFIIILLLLMDPFAGNLATKRAFLSL